MRSHADHEDVDPRGVGEMPAIANTDVLRTQIAEYEWYHTLELAPGLVTPGWFDNRSVTHLVPLPPVLDGKRCLDVGTFDGFWAFELERRGASEVMAIDILDARAWDWPLSSTPEAIQAIGQRKAGGRGFEIAQQALRSSVVRKELSVYDLEPASIGTFDFVFVGSLLLHLQNPVRALERVREVCTGELLVVDAVDAMLSWVFRRRPLAELDGVGRPWWWKPNAAGLVRMIEAAGFEPVGEPTRLRVPRGAGQPRPAMRPETLRYKEGRAAIARWWRGDQHLAVLARPVGEVFGTRR